MMRTLTVVAADNGAFCLSGNCPTVFRTETGSFIVQGKVLDDETKAAMGMPTSEDAVEIPAQLLTQWLNA